MVIAALNSFAQRELEPFLLADRVGHCAEHDSADIRGVYMELFGQGAAACSAEAMLPV